MKYSEYRDKKIPDGEIESHAEVLAAMDCLMHHLNDEDAVAAWLQDGVPDSGNWQPFGFGHPPPEQRQEYYEGLVDGMTYGDFEACAAIFAHTVKSQCFRTRYTPRTFT